MALKTTPFWHEDRPQRQSEFDALPAKADIAVIGAGYTGLSAALHLARAGRHVVVMDAEDPGFGCSSRNGGMVGPSFHKLSVAGLTAEFGEQKAHDLLREGMKTIAWFRDFVAAEKIDCDLSYPGRFLGACTPRDYEALARSTEDMKKAVGLEAEMVPLSGQHAEIGSDLYHGGAVYPRDGAVNPAKLVDGLCVRARQAGAVIVAPCKVGGWVRDGKGFTLNTSVGTLAAGEIVVATNGYTGPELKHFHRRIIPIPSVIAATEELDSGLMRKFSPKGRILGETRRIFHYFRPSPDGKRMLFGSRTTAALNQPEKLAANLRKSYSQIFPELADTPVTHCWYGFVAYSFDHAPHIGEADGVHYAMGYCGSGVTRSSYFGYKLAQKITGGPDARTAYDDLPFKTKPYYFGTPWGLNGLIAWHVFRDRVDRWRS